MQPEAARHESEISPRMIESLLYTGMEGLAAYVVKVSNAMDGWLWPAALGLCLALSALVLWATPDGDDYDEEDGE